MEYNLYFTHAQGKVIPEHLHTLVSQFESIVNNIINSKSKLNSFYLLGELENEQCYFAGFGCKNHLLDILNSVPDSDLQ